MPKGHSARNRLWQNDTQLKQTDKRHSAKNRLCQNDTQLKTDYGKMTLS